MRSAEKRRAAAAVIDQHLPEDERTGTAKKRPGTIRSVHANAYRESPRRSHKPTRDVTADPDVVCTHNGFVARSRRGWNMTSLLPEFETLPEALQLDGELVALDPTGPA